MNTTADLIGKSAAIRKLREEIPHLSKTNRLHIVGAGGSGKSFVARLIHENAKTRAKFVVLNQSSSPEQTIRESFKSLPEESTILIQDLEEFSFLNQGALAQSIHALPKKHASRIIATTKEPLAELRREETVLKDLLNLLKSFHTVFIPPLSKRTEDIPLLVEYFIMKACESAGRTLKVIDINALDFLIRREWQGNVLELKSVIEKAVMTSDEETIELPSSLVDEYSQFEGIVANIDDKKSFAFDKSLSNLEKTLIERTLKAVGYHQAKAAELLNISPENLRYRLKKFKISTTDK